MKKRNHYPFTWIALGVFCTFVGGIALAQPDPNPVVPLANPTATTTAQSTAAPTATSEGTAAAVQPAPTTAPSATGSSTPPAAAPQGATPASPVAVVVNAKRKAAQEKFGLYKVLLVGDATAQAYSDDTTSSFGGGLDFSTFQWNFMFALRIGSDEGALADEKSIGRFILTPENFGKPSLDVRAQYFPDVDESNYESIYPCIGAQIYYRGSETAWAIPISGMDEPQKIRGNVNAFGIGGVARFIPIATNSNHIEVQGAMNAAVRIIGGDVALPQTVDGTQRALEIALDNRQRVYFIWEILHTSLRIRSLHAGFNLSYAPGSIDGLSNFQYAVSVALHDGPVLSTVDPEEE